MIIRYDRVVILACCVVILGTDGCRRKETLQEQASTWQEGKPVPNDLLNYKVPASSKGWYGPNHTLRVLADTKDYPLLLAILFDPKTDEQVFECARERALALVGPTRFFSDIKSEYEKNKDLLTQDRHKQLLALSQKIHVLMDSLFINESDMPEPEASEVLKQISGELRTNSWDKVYGTFCQKYTYEVESTAPDGTKKMESRSKIGNFGRFVISPSNRSAKPFRDVSVPEEHAATLIESHKDDAVILKDDAAHVWRLYYVSEVYKPGT